MKEIFTLLLLFIFYSNILPQNTQNNNPFIIRMDSIVKHDYKLDINIQKPIVDDEMIQKDINDFLNKLVDDFMNDVTDAKKDMDSTYYIGSELDASCEFSGYKSKVASIIFNIFIFNNGAHGYNYMQTFNYDLKNQKRLMISNILKDKKDLIKIANLLIPKLKEQFEKRAETLDGFDEEGLKPEDKNFTMFYFTNDGISFYFPPYQIGPYAAGDFEVLLTYNELKNILNIKF